MILRFVQGSLNFFFFFYFSPSNVFDEILRYYYFFFAAFKEMDENIEYVEAEDEFDIVSFKNKKKRWFFFLLLKPLLFIIIVIIPLIFFNIITAIGNAFTIFSTEKYTKC